MHVDDMKVYVRIKLIDIYSGDTDLSMALNFIAKWPKEHALVVNLSKTVTQRKNPGLTMQSG